MKNSGQVTPLLLQRNSMESTRWGGRWRWRHLRRYILLLEITNRFKIKGKCTSRGKSSIEVVCVIFSKITNYLFLSFGIFSLRVLLQKCDWQYQSLLSLRNRTSLPISVSFDYAHSWLAVLEPGLGIWHLGLKSRILLTIILQVSSNFSSS